MNNVHFQVRGSSFSYGGFYRGFGLTITVYLLFSAFLAWHLGTLASGNPQAIGLLGWVFMAVQVASVVLSWKYFSAAPAMLSAIVAVCLGWAAWVGGGKGYGGRIQIATPYKINIPMDEGPLALLLGFID